MGDEGPVKPLCLSGKGLVFERAHSVGRWTAVGLHGRTDIRDDLSRQLFGCGAKHSPCGGVCLCNDVVAEDQNGIGGFVEQSVILLVRCANGLFGFELIPQVTGDDEHAFAGSRQVRCHDFDRDEGPVGCDKLPPC